LNLFIQFSFTGLLN